MWALRRASANSFRVQGFKLTAFQAFAGLGSFSSHAKDKSSNPACRGFTVDRLITLNKCQGAPNQFLVDSRSLCLQDSVNSDRKEGEDEFENWFSKFKTPEASDTTGKASYTSSDSGFDLSFISNRKEGKGDFENWFSEFETPEASKTTGKASYTSSDSEFYLSNAEDIVEKSLETEHAEVNDGETVLQKKMKGSSPYKLYLEKSSQSISGHVDSYVPEGKDVNCAKMFKVLQKLIEHKEYLKALKLSEWLEEREGFNFTERDYASRVDLIFKVYGLKIAENYIDKIPETHRQEAVYRTFLSNCVSRSYKAKAEDTFNRMKDLGFPMSAFVCNQMLIIYKRTSMEKIADLLLMMEKEDIKPSLFTYQLLIDAKGAMKDIVGMEQIVETMEAEGFKPNIRVQATIARHYAFCGCNEKAEAVLKEIEGRNLNSDKWICHIVLPIYANLGSVDGVRRVWKICESNPHEAEYLAALDAWGTLKNIEQAETVFKMMTKAIKNLNSAHFSSLWKIYAQNKMLSKGKEMLKQMDNSGCITNPFAWNSLVEICLDVGDIEEAELVLNEAIQQNQQMPLYISYMSILDHYAERGDIQNAERTFHKMRQEGYLTSDRPLNALLEAYKNLQIAHLIAN